MHMLRITTLILSGLLLAIPGRGQSSFAVWNGETTLIGPTDRKTLETTPGYDWFKTGYAAYTPDAARLQKLRPLVRKVKVRVYMGSWCDDTHLLLPRFFKVADMLGLSPESISLVALNREKRDDGNFAIREVDRIPYFIFYYENLETGKIIESTRSIEESLLEIYKPYIR